MPGCPLAAAFPGDRSSHDTALDLTESAERESVTTEPFLLQADVNEESYN